MPARAHRTVVTARTWKRDWARVGIQYYIVVIIVVQHNIITRAHTTPRTRTHAPRNTRTTTTIIYYYIVVSTPMFLVVNTCDRSPAIERRWRRRRCPRVEDVAHRSPRPRAVIEISRTGLGDAVAAASSACSAGPIRFKIASSEERREKI